MKCSGCQHENREAAKFCEECASPLKRACSSCGCELRPTAKFCDECGTPTVTSTPTALLPARSIADYTPAHLAERIRAEQVALETRGATDGERKTITALFADLKGSTALIEGLDPEEVRALIDPALQLMMDAVHQYDGYVAQALGDGIFALFGAPLAHEDHPQRAVYAALRMQEAMGRYADALRSKGYPPLKMRVGLNTGEVLVRSIRKDDLHTDYVPVGHSTNLAARMEQLADPGSIVVSAYTHRLTDGYFAFKDLGPTQVKGVEEPLNIYEVLSVGPLRTRLQVSARRGLTRFVGRQSEMEQLNKALESAKAGHGQIVGVMGEPGLGKSRLFYEFKLLSIGGCLLLEAYSVSHGKATAYLPVIELLKGYFDIQMQDDERRRREKVGGKVLMLERSLEDTLRYLFALLGIEEQPSPLQQMDPEFRRQRTFEALRRLFLRESLNQPLILIFEDLHWIDSETQGLLDVLSECVGGAKLLLLTNYRPEYRHEWGQKTYCTQLRLAPLGKVEAEELLTFLLGDDASLVPAKPLILERTQGTPFFIEEVVQTLVEDGTLTGAPGQYRLTRSLSALQLPATVQAILAARIDRLAADEKALLQQLSVIGREFSLSLVRQVLTQPEVELYRLLASLQHKEFLYEQPAFPEVEYIFKHALTQEVAYGTVLHERRKVLHEQTAQAMGAVYADQIGDHYGALAHHYSRSGNVEKAVEYLELAGRQAAQRMATNDAVNYLSRALELLVQTTNSAERDHKEMTLLGVLYGPLISTKGMTSPEVERCSVRRRDLALRIGTPEDLFGVLLSLRVYYSVLGDAHAAMRCSAEVLALAESNQKREFSLHAHLCLCIAHFGLGEFPQAVTHSTRLREFRGFGQDNHQEFEYGYEPFMLGGVYEGLALQMLGYPRQALERINEELTAALRLGHPYFELFVRTQSCILFGMRRDFASTLIESAAAISLAGEIGAPDFHAWSLVQHGCALIEMGDAFGVEEVAAGFEMCRDANTEYILPFLQTSHAAARLRRGDTNGARGAVADGLAIAVRTGEAVAAAELLRLQGELALRAEGDLAAREQEAESHFHAAIAIARQQQARSWELRAAVSLARLWDKQGKRESALQQLQAVYDWFVEGFDTIDLLEAKELLDSLARVPIGVN